ncbi:GntR family transcriptional regulator [Streptomyces sp. MS06]|uniref:GntR family transcriptional regulator n=1 Tax=Streptomyces sp. MS06 TaxID=3385974 RepID=UPI0039A2DC15
MELSSLRGGRPRAPVTGRPGSRLPSGRKPAGPFPGSAGLGEQHHQDQAEIAGEFGVERGAVRQALRALQDDGLLTHVSKGSPPRIAEPAPPSLDRPQPTMVGLAPRLAEAFTAERVRIDVVCHTAETLMVALGEPLRLIHRGSIRPRSVALRILLPSDDIDLAFPVPVETTTTTGDDPVHQRWLAMRNAQGQVIEHQLLSLRATHGIDVRVAFRALPFTPPMKLYLLNGAEALFGHYLVTRREEEWQSLTLDMFDVLGSQWLLFFFDRRSGGRDAAFVDESQKWFDALWETITSDLSLSP